MVCCCYVAIVDVVVDVVVVDIVVFIYPIIAFNLFINIMFLFFVINSTF